MNVIDVTGISQVLSTVDRGTLKIDLDDALKEVVQAVQENGGKGKLSIELVLKYDSKLGAMRVHGNMKKQIPAPERKETLYFVTPEGNLTRNDPSQMSLLDR